MCVCVCVFGGGGGFVLGPLLPHGIQMISLQIPKAFHHHVIAVNTAIIVAEML